MRNPLEIAPRAGAWSARRRRLAIGGWFGFVVAALVIGGMTGTKTLDYDRAGVGESGRADRAIDDAFPSEYAEEVVLVSSERYAPDDPEFHKAVSETIAALASSPDTDRIVSPYDSGKVSPTSNAALIEYRIPGEDDELDEKVDPVFELIAGVDAEHPEIALAGFGGASADQGIGEKFEEDFRKAEVTALPVTLLVLLIAFGALVAAGIPLLLAATAVAATIGLIGPISQALPVDESITSVVFLIGLAVGVDYSMFYLRREREERASGRDERSSLLTAASTSGRAVLVSGLVVMIAMAGMYLGGAATFQSFATGTILVVAIALVGSLSVLPAMLAWLGDRIEKGRIPFLARKRQAGESRFWAAILDPVLRHPLLSGGLAAALLIALTLPVLNFKTQLPGLETLPRSIPVVQTYDEIQAAFPGDQAPAIVAVRAEDVTAPEVEAGVADLQAASAESDGFAGPGEIRTSRDRTLTEVSLPMFGDGSNEVSQAALGELRGELIPATIESVPGVTAEVSGFAAGTEDFNTVLSERLPWVFAFVLTMAFLLLLVTFRSIVVPIKAIILNLLSVGAAYGVLKLIFQDGRLEGLLGFESTGAITSWLPLFLFVVLFGLSMDYHVFILSRVREAVDQGMTTRDATAKAIRSTAGVITSAAAIMIAVFAIFATLSMIEFKQMGVGLAVAVLIDATVIRAVLLPSAMVLLGELNWYLPRWLDWLPRVSLRETDDSRPAEA